MKPLLVADCVSKSFKGRQVLSAASLRAVEGEVRVMLGRNGAGKSTLLKIAAGWIQPDNGVVHYADEARLSVRLPSLAERGLFYLPDHDLFSSAFPVRMQLEMFRRQFAGAAVDESLEAVGVRGLGGRYPGALSGGELRRAELAAVLVRRPRCLLADEPLRGISPRDAEDLGRLFRAIARAGTAVVLTGHEVSALTDVADHVTWCTAGTTYELGPPHIALRHQGLRLGYLGGWHPGIAGMGCVP